MERIEVLGAGAGAWDELLERCRHDAYHTAGFHRFAGGSGEGEPRLVVVRDGDRGLAWPYLLRRLAVEPVFAGTDATDVTSVYGYPGPVAWGCTPGDPFLDVAWRAVVGTWRDDGAVAAFTRFNPLLRNESLVPEARPGMGSDVVGTILQCGPTVSVDCTVDDETANAGYARALRQHIAAARRAGLTTVEDTSWDALPEFARMYERTMVRNAAADYYFFTRDDFERLRHGLGPQVHLLTTRHANGVAAAGLFTECDGIVQAHLVGTDEAFLRLSPAKLLFDDARRWARERGDRLLHLGGGRGGREDSLFFFKREFSPRRHEFHTGRWILDRARYAQFSRAVGGHSEDRVADGAAFFPGYRWSGRTADGSAAAGKPIGEAVLSG